jgi:hypothetical protein
VSLIYTTDSTASDAQTVRLTLSSKDWTLFRWNTPTWANSKYFGITK